jgi:hypothetical protein
MGADRTHTSSSSLYDTLYKRNRNTGVSEPIPSNLAPVSPSSPIHRKASCACGGGCPNCQAKSNDLKVSDPNDAAEVEADRIADKVMRMPAGNQAPTENRSISPGMIYREFDASKQDEEEETIQRKPLPGSNGIPAQSPAHVHDAVGSGGRALDQGTRGFFESRMGYDFGGVRIHTDSTAGLSARAIDAKAYTAGNNIVFGSGQYSPNSASGMRLLAHELAHVVQSGHTANGSGRNVLHRDRRRRRGGGTPPPPPTPDYFIDGQKKIFKQDAAGGQLIEVGFEDSAGKRYVTADDKDMSTNNDGKLYFGGGLNIELLRKFYVLKANDLAASPVAGHTAIDKKGIASTSYRMISGGKNYEILTAGDKPDSIPTPILVTKLHADISAKFVQKGDIDLDSGHYWILLKFAKPPDTVEALHWTKAKETRKEFSKRRGEIVDVANTLPANLKTEALKHRDLLTAISITEGNFKAAATGGDTHASLGIFQWALEKDKSTDPHSSLVQYFQTLKERAAAASAKAVATRTDEEKLFIAAWAQLRAKGVDVTAGGTAQMGGDPATGSQLQTSLASEFGTDSLQKYQIQAALDKIEDARSLIIRPRYRVKDPFGSGYSDERNKGATAFFESDLTFMRTVRGTATPTKKHFELEVDAPAAAARLKDILKTEESLAVATTIYANRPNYVPTAIWFALKGDVDLTAKVKELTAKIAETERAASKSLMPINTSALEPASVPLLKELRELIWIDASKFAVPETEIVANMIRLALSFYPRADIKKYERWERIATALAPFNTPNW